MKYLSYFTIILFVIFSACRKSAEDPRLVRISDIVSDSPLEAMESLDSINPEHLSESDRYFYEFLNIKAKDKAFIKHTSDSIILQVVDYYSHHKDENLYPEALYYAGRVYHDMGDYPTSLKYYQNALNVTGQGNNNLDLRGCVLSQISNVLNSLRLYHKAIPYLREALMIDSIRNDKDNLLFDIEMLGLIYLNNKQTDSAEYVFKSGLYKAQESGLPDTTTFKLYLGIALLKKGKLESARKSIDTSIVHVDSNLYDMAIGFMSQAYKQKNVPDSALKYAYELIRSKNLANRKTGYRVILSKEMIKHIPFDSIIEYVSDYTSLVNIYLDQNGDRSALIQDSFYNYQMHERDKFKAEEESINLRNALALCIVFVLILCMIMLYLRYKNKSQRLQLYDAITHINSVRHAIKQDNTATTSPGIEKDGAIKELNEYKISSSPGIVDLRERLRKEVLAIQRECKNDYSIPLKILESEVYQDVLRHIGTEQILSDKHPLWTELESIVMESFPYFRHRLSVLTDGKITNSEFQVALLLKCGIPATDIAILVGRAKSTIVYRRKKLASKIFGEDLGIEVIDNIIRVL